MRGAVLGKMALRRPLDARGVPVRVPSYTLASPPPSPTTRRSRWPCSGAVTTCRQGVPAPWTVGRTAAGSGDGGRRVPVGVWVDGERPGSGLGRPARGIARVYKKDAGGRLQFIGEDRLAHTPENEVVRLRWAMPSMSPRSGGRPSTAASIPPGTNRTKRERLGHHREERREEAVTCACARPCPATGRSSRSRSRTRRHRPTPLSGRFPVPARIGRVDLPGAGASLKTGSLHHRPEQQTARARFGAGRFCIAAGWSQSVRRAARTGAAASRCRSAAGGRSWFPGPRASRRWAIHPGSRPRANITVNMLVGMPRAR